MNSGSVPYTKEPKPLLYGFNPDFVVSKYSPTLFTGWTALVTMTRKRSSGWRF